MPSFKKNMTVITLSRIFQFIIKNNSINLLVGKVIPKLD